MCVHWHGVARGVVSYPPNVGRVWTRDVRFVSTGVAFVRAPLQPQGFHGRMR